MEELDLLSLTDRELYDLAQSLDDEQIERARNNYIDYLRYVHSDWKDGKHLLFICKQLDDFLNNRLMTSEGKIARYLLLSLPPQNGKSMTITETLPSWWLGKHKNDRVIALAYGEDLARKFGKRNLNKIQEFGKKIFNIELDPNSKSVTDFDLLGHKGSMITRGISAGVTGNPGDLIIVDDPFRNREDAQSENVREKTWEEFLFSVNSRLSAKGKCIIIHTRWHTDDLIGRIDFNKKRFRSVYFNIPCEAEENDILGRKVGDPLFPEIGKDKEWLEEIKDTLVGKEGRSAWFSLYQGKPVIDGGEIFKKEWINYYKREELPELAKTIISVDATFKDEKNSDFVAIQVWGKSNNKYFLIDEVHERLNFPSTILAIRRLKQKYPKTSNILIEDKANGSAIIQVLRRELDGITPIEPKGGKIARANAVAHLFESGQVYFPFEKDFTYEFEQELMQFPNGKHDDRVDSMSQALSRLIQYKAIVLTNEQKEAEEKIKDRYFDNVKAFASSKRANKAYIQF